MSGARSTWDEFGSRIALGYPPGDEPGETGDPGEPFVVQLLGGVRGLVVIGVGSGEQVEGGHALAVERRRVGGQVGVVGQRQIESPRHVGALHDARPDTRGTHRLHREPVLVEASHHVQVDIGEKLIRPDLAPEERPRTQKPGFLAGTRSRSATAGRAGPRRRCGPAPAPPRCPRHCRRRPDGPPPDREDSAEPLPPMPRWS